MNTLTRIASTGVLFLVLGVGSFQVAHALIMDITVDGSDAIFLAGRTDIVIPPASDPWDSPAGMRRHAGPTPEEILETLPPLISVNPGDVIRALDPAVGGISFFNGFGAPLFGPDGGPGAQTNLSGFGGISGFLSDGQGPLAGVFLDNTIPSVGAPAILDFRSGAIGTDFPTLMPSLGQVFFIGDGQTSGGVFHEFTAPAGATRLALGIPDGFGFQGVPGAYDDNDGAYRIRIGINEVPTIPEPAAIILLSIGMIGLGLARRQRRLNV